MIINVENSDTFFQDSLIDIKFLKQHFNVNVVFPKTFDQFNVS